MKLSSIVFFLLFCNRTNASRQSTNPTIMCKRGDVFACCSVQFVAVAVSLISRCTKIRG